MNIPFLKDVEKFPMGIHSHGLNGCVGQYMILVHTLYSIMSKQLSVNTLFKYIKC